MAENKTPPLSVRGGSNVAAIMPKISAAVTERTQGTKIDLSSAENWLLRPELIEICKEAIASNLNAQDLSYPRAFSGFPEVLSAFARFLNEHFNPVIPVEISHLATAPGAASCLDTLLYNICDPGDGILVPGPYWSGFDFQFKARSSVVPISVVTENLDSTLSHSLIPALEHAFDNATIPIKGLLMSNPHNPLGQCYPRSCIEECIKFCQERNIHYISDEVYAMTNFHCPELPVHEPFISALSIDVSEIGCDLSRIHTVWSTSKDFGQSGVRMGCTVTQGNKEMAVGLPLASNTQTSTLSSIFVSALLTSPMIPDLLALNSARLSEAYCKVTAILKKHGLRYFPSYAGLYLFAKIVPNEPSWEDESRVVEEMKDRGVLVSAGRGYHGPESEKGWARIGFAVPKEQLDEAIKIMDSVFQDEERLREEKLVTPMQKGSGVVGHTLNHLIDSLQETLVILKGDAKEELFAALHNHETLPDKRISGLASKAIDLLHEAEQLLEPGSSVLADHFLGYVNSKCLVAAVELNIPDILRLGPMTLAGLAKESRAQPHRLRQVLRALHNNGIFSYDEPTDTYNNNSTSTLLLSDHWTKWRNWVDLYGNEFYDIARGIPASCREDSTRTAAQVNFDTDENMFTYFTEQGWLPRLHGTLSGGATAQAPGILEDYPWDEVADGLLLDIGGGGGGLVALLLRKYTNMRGGILDLEEVIGHATHNFHSPDGEYADVGERVSRSDLIVGDFLVQIPRYQVYTMKWCLHDWDDSKALKVMTNIRKAIIRGPRSRLVVLESLLTEGQAGRLSRYADLNIMMTAGGQERNEAQWKHLAKQTGWKIKKIYPLRNAWPCAIELVPIWENEDAVTNGVTSTKSNGTVTSVSQTANSNGVIRDKVATNGTAVNGNRKLALKSDNSDAARGSQVSTTMSFLEPWDGSKGEPYYRSIPDEGFKSTNFKWVEHQTTITNARPNKPDFTLDKNGFCYEDDVEGLTPDLIEALRIGVKETVQELYYPKVEKLVKKLTNASRIIVFDHTVRKRDPTMKKEDNHNGKEQPATVVHCDQSAKGALRRLKQNLGDGDDLDTILKGRVQLLNVWRPLKGPVVDWPLAMMDFQTLAPVDIHPCDLWRHQFEERGQTVTFTHCPNQRWYYLDKHLVDEVSIIKIWDSKDGGVANMCPHAAFAHPDTPEGTPPRESVEVRCIVIHDPVE